MNETGPVSQLGDSADERTIMTAEEFADDVDGEKELRYNAQQNAHWQRQTRVWGPVIALCVLGFFAMIATIVWCVTTEHDHEHAHQVSVWCYADPNRSDATSELVGSPADVLGKCPGDQPTPGQSFDPNNP